MESEEEGKAAFRHEKHVKIMTDYGADPIWNKIYWCAPTHWLPVAPSLIAELNDWQREFDDAEPLPYASTTTFDSAGHWRRGLRIALRVKEELPDWTVIYREGGNPIEIP